MMARPAASLAALVLLAACGSTGGDGAAGGGQGQGGQGDGRHHPASNGTPMDEAGACDALSNALETKRSQLMCTTTLRTCPSLVRFEGGEPCLQYDQGTIQGCVEYYGQASSCDDLSARIEACAFEAIAGSAPNGCP